MLFPNWHSSVSSSLIAMRVSLRSNSSEYLLFYICNTFSLFGLCVVHFSCYFCVDLGLYKISGESVN